MQTRAGQPQSSSTGAVLPLSGTLTAALSWTTHVAVLDDYLRSHTMSEVILRALGDIPLKERISTLRGAVSKQPANPDAWLNACLKPHHGKTYAGPQPVMHGPPSKMPRIDNHAGTEPAMVAHTGRNQQTTCASAAVKLADTPSEIEISNPQRSLWAMSPKKSMLIPDRVKELYAASGNKSAYVKIIYNQLDPLRLQRYAEMSPAVQYHIAMSVMLNPIAWASVSDYVTQCMLVYSRLQNPDVGDCPVSGSICQETRLVIVHVNAGIGDGHIAVHAALVMLKKIRPTTVFSVKSVHSFGNEDDDGCIEKSVIAKLHSTSS